MLEAYGIEGVEERGGVSRFHEDSRGIYYVGSYWLKDPSWDPNGWKWGVIAFVNPRGEDGIVVSGGETMQEIHGQVQPVFRLASEEVDYFNAVLFPKLRAAYPSLSAAEELAVSYYSLKHHFEDSEQFLKEARLRSRWLPEQPVFETRLNADSTGNWVPYYTLSGAPGQPTTRSFGTKYEARSVWPSVESARADRSQKGHAGKSPSIPVEDMSVAELYAHYTALKQQRDAAVEQALRDSAAAYLTDVSTSGIVFRNSDYWSRFEKADVLRQIFHREYDRIEHPYEAAALYVSYVTAFDDVCHAHLPPPPNRAKATTIIVTSECDSSGFDCRTIDETEHTVEMHPDFFVKYEEIANLARSGRFMSQMAELLEAMPTWQGGGGTAFLGGMFDRAANLLRRRELLRRFLREEQCTGPGAAQLRENLLEMVGAESTVPRPRVTAANVDTVTETDIRREEQWLRRQAERDEAAKAASPVEGPDGWPYAEEDFGEFTARRAGDLDASMAAGPYRDAVRAAKTERHPVLYCRYGPTGLDGELPTWRHWSFWYGRVPPEANAIHAFSVTRKAGMVKLAVTECPATTGAVERLIEGVPAGARQMRASEPSTSAVPAPIAIVGTESSHNRAGESSGEVVDAQPASSGTVVSSEVGSGSAAEYRPELTLEQALERVQREFRAKESEADARYVEALAAARSPGQRQGIIRDFAAQQQLRQRERDERLAEVRKAYTQRH